MGPWVLRDPHGSLWSSTGPRVFGSSGPFMGPWGHGSSWCSGSSEHLLLLCCLNTLLPLFGHQLRFHLLDLQRQERWHLGHALVQFFESASVVLTEFVVLGLAKPDLGVFLVGDDPSKQSGRGLTPTNQDQPRLRGLLLGILEALEASLHVATAIKFVPAFQAQDLEEGEGQRTRVLALGMVLTSAFWADALAALSTNSLARSYLAVRKQKRPA